MQIVHVFKKGTILKKKKKTPEAAPPPTLELVRVILGRNEELVRSFWEKIIPGPSNSPNMMKFRSGSHGHSPNIKNNSNNFKKTGKP